MPYSICDWEAQRHNQHALTCHRRIVSLVVGAGLLATAQNHVSAQAPAPASSLEQRIDQLEHELRLLKDELQQQNVAKKPEAGPIVSADANGFRIQSADGNFNLSMRGVVQADARFYLDSANTAASDTFLLRRVRPSFEGTVFKDFEFRLMPDFGGGQAVLYDAYLNFHHWDWLQLMVGKYKPPLGLERTQLDRDVEFVERALPSDFIPSRDVGVSLSGTVLDGVLNYSAGVFNGVADGSLGDFAAWNGKEFAARLFVMPFKQTSIEAAQNLGFGLSGSTGNVPGTTNAPALPSFKTTGQQTFFSYQSRTNSPGLAFADGPHTRLSPFGYWYWGPVGLLGEYVLSDQRVSRGTTSRYLANDAWQLAGYWVVTGENASFNGVTPRRPFDLDKGGWGALEFVTRYSQLRLDGHAFAGFADLTKSARAADAWAVGLNWHFNRFVKLALDYEQTSFGGGAGTTGAIGDRPQEKVIFSRAQLAF